MGTIYLKADLTCVTEENIKQFNITQLDCEEVHDLIRAGHRNILLKMTTTPNIHYYIDRYEQLTKEECEEIIRHNVDIWDDISSLYSYSSEFLLEHGEKLARMRIEGQRNITPEFVRRHEESLNIGTLFRNREHFGDLLDFLVTPSMSRQYLSRYLSWRVNKETLIQSLYNCNLNEELLLGAIKFINNWFDTPVDLEKLVSDYQDQDRASYSIDTVTDYWNRNSQKPKYSNWEEYVNECNTTGDDGLANTWFNSFFRQPLLEILGYND